jgi:hypothetical protein
MWYRTVVQPTRAFSPLTSWYAEELLPRIQHALSELADLDVRQERERDDLQAIMPPGPERARMTRELEHRHASEREFYVRRLEDLQDRLPALAPDPLLGAA